MTVIEFFDKTAIENILSALLCQPDKVIFIGDSVKRMKQSMAAYSDVLRGRCLDVEMVCKSVNKNNLQSIVDVLAQIIEENEDCVFNLDGGEDLCLVAVGMIAQRYGRRIQLHRFNVRNSTIIDCDADGEDQQMEPIAIRVEENIRVYGGRVVYVHQREDATYPWVFNSEFCQDIRSMWRICSVNPRQWNWVVSLLDKMRRTYCEDINSLDVRIPYTGLVSATTEDGVEQLRMILGLLNGFGIIQGLGFDEGGIVFSYKNQQIKHCLAKAGTLLELYIAIVAKGQFAQDERVYNDVMCGVCLDWDGVLQADNMDVTNEIDVILMHGAVPVFISCKNGDLEQNELYKLYTVAERFGGKYAKKVLVASSLEELGAKSEHIRLRARELGIRIVEDVDGMDEKELGRIISSLWSN